MPHSIPTEASLGTGKQMIILIHDLWLKPESLELFKNFYYECGYEVLSPAWPRMENFHGLRENADLLAGLGLLEIVDHYAEFVRRQNQTPILIGHGFGGLVVQMLLDRGLGKVGVAIAAPPPRGILLVPFSVLQAANSILRNPKNYERAVTLSFKQFRKALANTVPVETARVLYDTYAIPGPARPLFEVALASLNPRTRIRVHHRNSHRGPLLLIVGAKDRLVPPVLNRINYKKYVGWGAVTGFKEFPGRSHLLVAEVGWPEVADYALTWVQQQIAKEAEEGKIDILTPADFEVVETI
jgi:pimeloyl-ACP methyl ester carboxylesterase